MTRPSLPDVDGDGHEAHGEGSVLVVVCGLPGSGKTTLATALAADMGAVRFGADDWMEAAGISLWDSEARSLIESFQRSLAERYLLAGRSVIIEWGTWQRAERESLRQMAAHLGCARDLYSMVVPEEVLWRRVRERALEDPAMTRDDLRRAVMSYEAPTSAEGEGWTAFKVVEERS